MERGGEDGEERGRGKERRPVHRWVIITVPTLDAATSPEDAGARGASLAVA
jgi:hypothetical protein